MTSKRPIQEFEAVPFTLRDERPISIACDQHFLRALLMSWRYARSYIMSVVWMCNT